MTMGHYWGASKEAADITRIIWKWMYMVEEWAKPIGAAIAFVGGAIATGWAQSRIGAGGTGTIAEKPEMAGIVIILEAIPETMTILGFVIAAIIMLL